MKARDYRARAREALRGHWFIAIIASLIVSIITGCFTVTYKTDGEVDSVIPENDTSIVSTVIDSVSQQGSGDGLTTVVTIAYVIFALIFLFACFVQIVVTGVMSVGQSRFYLDLLSQYPLKLRTVFSGFKNFRVAAVAFLKMFLRVLGGTLLFVIPGIIICYTYALLGYVIADNPRMSADETLQECKRIMKGNRWKLFCLSMSFFGWALLGVLTFGIGLLWVMPYQSAAIAEFYREAKKNA